MASYAVSSLLFTPEGVVQCGASGLVIEDYDTIGPSSGSGGLKPQPWKKDQIKATLSPEPDTSNRPLPPRPGLRSFGPQTTDEAPRRKGEGLVVLIMVMMTLNQL